MIRQSRVGNRIYEDIELKVGDAIAQEWQRLTSGFMSKEQRQALAKAALTAIIVGRDEI